MTRDEIAARIHWRKIIWLAGFANVASALPQLWALITTHETKGIAIETYYIALIVQIAFTLEGYFTRNRVLMVCIGLSGLVSGSIIGLIVYFRYFN